MMKTIDLNNKGSNQGDTPHRVTNRSSFRRTVYKVKEPMTSNIFVLPQSVFEKSLSSPWSPPPMKKYGKHENLIQKELGEVGRQYENILRKTIFNQTQLFFRTKRQRSLLEHRRSHITLQIDINPELKKRNIRSISNHTENKNTLKILEKYIIKNPEGLLMNYEETIELESKKLPIIRKERKRERVEPNYHPKYKWEPQPKQTREEIQQIIALGEKKKVVEKPQIRGWDQEELF